MLSGRAQNRVLTCRRWPLRCRSRPVSESARIWGTALVMIGVDATGTGEGSTMDLSDFTLDTLHKHGEFVLSRGRRRSGTSPCPTSVLVVMPRSEHSRPETVRMLEHEYSLRIEVDSAWAVTPIEITQYEGRTVLILDDPGGEPLAQLVGTPMEMGQFLRVAIGISAAVRQLHGRN